MARGHRAAGGGDEEVGFLNRAGCSRAVVGTREVIYAVQNPRIGRACHIGGPGGIDVPRRVQPLGGLDVREGSSLGGQLVPVSLGHAGFALKVREVHADVARRGCGREKRVEENDRSERRRPPF